MIPADGRSVYLHTGSPAHRRQPVHRDDPALDELHPQLRDLIIYVGELDVVPSRGISDTGTSRRTSYSVAVKDLCDWICSATEDWLRYARREPKLSAAIDRCSRIMRMNLDGTRTPL
jgi:hypothetical protein